tara:strand:- start:126 stop:467 length:342 start_codon:yes stop_codon:yes gene_type:complete
MKTSKINHLIEYLSMTLILSYFFIHKIFLVLIGIIVSSYLININFVNSIIKSINKNLINKKSTIELNQNDKLTRSNYNNIKSNKDDKKLTLVETIEELGFIPSLDKNQDSKAT